MEGSSVMASSLNDEVSEVAIEGDSNADSAATLVSALCMEEHDSGEATGVFDVLREESVDTDDPVDAEPYDPYGCRGSLQSV